MPSMEMLQINGKMSDRFNRPHRGVSWNKVLKEVRLMPFDGHLLDLSILFYWTNTIVAELNRCLQFQTMGNCVSKLAANELSWGPRVMR